MVPSYPSLGGCVRDINHIKHKVGLSNENIVMLTSSNSENNGDGKPSEPQELWPTYENMILPHSRKLQKQPSLEIRFTYTIQVMEEE